ncbi:CehA/McbA family metallohydrolase [Candidatus Formimonas warabiya]|uniref:CehA/McbA family metallohydrolase n=1 Tax=Formimonas warabiya TaxID=1761012 RepID=A0A3G1KZX3_FORW1|nr:CehA/McbA family metallohydrolase [Candidatus Formimonas warabiya]ATW27934.1 hypothetical protein DCMF_27115 [Candidatus Formimonas warabiya]
MKKTGFVRKVLFLCFVMGCMSFAFLVQAFAATNDQVVIKTVGELKAAGVPIQGTFIENGEALNDQDLVMFNKKIAIAVSVGTPNPWGYPPSSILDASLMIDNSASQPPKNVNESLWERVKDGSLKAGKDTIWDMEFLMDNWDSWSPSNSKPRDITVDDNIDFDGNGTKDGLQGIVSTRKYGQSNKTPMDVVTYYVLGNEDNYVRINTIVTNLTNGSVYDTSADGSLSEPGLETGYSLGNKGAYMFAPDKSVGDPYNKYVTTYNNDYNVSLIDLGCEINDMWGSSGYKDTVKPTVYQPGHEYQFGAIFRIDDEGSLEGTLNQLMDEAGAKKATVAGTVVDTATNQPVKNPIIVVEKGQKTFTWIIGADDGTFSFSLPALDDMNAYQVYALKELYSPSAKTGLTLAGGGYNTGSIGLTKTREITVHVKDNKGKPVDARLELLGVTNPAVRYVAQTVFYSDLHNIGVAKIPVAEGDYKIQISNGAYFESLPVTVEGNAATNNDLAVTINKLIDPSRDNWYSADLHHHSNKSDGSTIPENLVKSQLASDLNMVFTSDHDSIGNNKEIAGYAEVRDVAYTPSLEVSPSWAHFNILPVAQLTYDNMKSDNFSIDPYMNFPDMVKKVHDSEALMVANHPWIAYGLFTAQAANAIPGGYDADFDFIEINGSVSTALNLKALNSAMDFWTDSLAGDSKIYYLTGGSDTHDVLVPDMTTAVFSGNCRTFVNIPGDLNRESYLNALRSGHAYVTMGPVLWADGLGQTYTINKGKQFTLTFDAQDVQGITKVEIYTAGKVVADSKLFTDASMNKESFSFTFTPATSTWYNIVVTNTAGKMAISDPVWVKVISD